eukprot:UN02384
MGISLEDKNNIQKMQENKLFQNSKKVKCPKCSLTFIGDEADQSEAVNRQYMELGLDGQKISAEGINHKAKWRFRCSKCTTIFCGQCELTPYHLGFTCDSFKKRQEARKCRFCSVVLKGPAGVQSIEAIDNVCNEQECKDRAKNVCTKELSCGHWCNGCRAEKVHLKCLKCAKIEDDYCTLCYVEGP